jgi:hypothetical protein
MSDQICMLDKERFCMNKLWHLNFLAPTFWNWRQNLIPGDFSGANIFGARAAPDYSYLLLKGCSPLLAYDFRHNLFLVFVTSSWF